MDEATLSHNEQHMHVARPCFHVTPAVLKCSRQSSVERLPAPLFEIECVPIIPASLLWTLMTQSNQTKQITHLDGPALIEGVQKDAERQVHASHKPAQPVGPIHKRGTLSGFGNQVNAAHEAAQQQATCRSEMNSQCPETKWRGLQHRV